MKLRSRLWLAAMAATLPLRQAAVNHIVNGVHILEPLHFGPHSITLNSDILNFGATATPAAEGDVVFDHTAHVPKFHNGTAVKTFAQTDAVLALSGGTMSGNVAMGTNKITGLGNGSAGSQDATTVSQMESYVGDLIAQKVALGFAGEGLIGHGNASEVNALTPVEGNVIVSEASFTPSAGTSDALVAGDTAEFDGTSWKKIIAADGGFVPSGTRMLVSTASAFISGGGLTDATDEGKIAYFDGTSLSPASFTTPSDGVIVAVKGEGARSENKVLAFDGAVPTGAWRDTSAAGTDHNALANLTSGDAHTQYLKLAGRSGGQTQIGGTGAGDDLTFQSTSNATKGDIVLGQTGDTVKTGVDWVLTADINILPATNNTVTIGNGTYKLKSIRATTVTSGDHYFDGRHLGGGYFRLREGKAGLEMTPVDEDSQGNIFEVGETRKLVSVPKNPGRIRGAVLRALAIS